MFKNLTVPFKFYDPISQFITALIDTYPRSVQNTSLDPGRYKLRVWGAQGGFILNSTLCRGAYTEGLLKLNVPSKLNIYVGQQGQCSNSAINNVFFGGGLNTIGKRSDQSCTGGGSTFITFDNNISNIIIVAGSGGGSGYYIFENSKIEYLGGYGGMIAGNGTGSRFGTGATVNNPGIGGKYPGNSVYSSCSAKNGDRLTGGKSCSTAEASTGGGGSGYFGGGGGADTGGGGGGSSYASDILENIIYLNGNENMTEPTGTTNIGHVGNGIIIIENILFCSFGINRCVFDFNTIFYFIFVLTENK